MDEELPITYREALPEDLHFVYSSWLKSYREARASKLLTKTVYFHEHHKLLESLLKRSQVLVATNAHDPEQIFGYLCAESVPGFWVVHYVYVKQPYRKLGIARELLKLAKPESEEPIVYTHETDQGRSMAIKWKWIFNPYWNR